MTRKQKFIEHVAGAAGNIRPVVKGTRTRVSAIAQLHEQLQHETPAERIQYALPHLSIEEIEAALEYWRMHPEEIAEDIARDEAAFAAFIEMTSQH